MKEDNKNFVFVGKKKKKKKKKSDKEEKEKLTKWRALYHKMNL
jgi:hypothetical protein